MAKKSFIDRWIEKKSSEINSYLNSIFKQTNKLIKERFKIIKHIKKIVLMIIALGFLFGYLGYKVHVLFIKIELVCMAVLLVFITIFYSIYFIKAFLKERKIYRMNKKYKWLGELFNEKVKVVEVSKDSITINSYHTYSEILKKKELLENRFNKAISSINRKGKSFRTFVISFKEVKKARFKQKYFLKDYIEQPEKELSKHRIPFLLGVDEHEKPIIADLGKLNHILLSGDSDFGKSTIVNCLLQSMQYFNENIIYVLVDFKLVELKTYDKLNNVVFVNEKSFVDYLEKIDDEMENRKQKLVNVDLQNVKQYNKKYPNDKIPYIVYLIDEVADLRISQASSKKELEEIEMLMLRLLLQGRAFGVHCIFATQKPSGVQLSTEIRDGLITKMSLRIRRTIAQDMAGVRGTEKLKVGEFLIIPEDGEKKLLKSFFCDREESWEVFKTLLEKRRKKDVVTF